MPDLTTTRSLVRRHRQDLEANAVRRRLVAEARYGDPDGPARIALHTATHRRARRAAPEAVLPAWA